MTINSYICPFPVFSSKTEASLHKIAFDYTLFKRLSGTEYTVNMYTINKYNIFDVKPATRVIA